VSTQFSCVGHQRRFLLHASNRKNTQTTTIVSFPVPARLFPLRRLSSFSPRSCRYPIRRRTTSCLPIGSPRVPLHYPLHHAPGGFAALPSIPYHIRCFLILFL
jgi:hypothetical protein